MLNFRFVLGIFITSSLVFGQGDPIEHLAVDRVETRNFEIVVQRSSEPVRPTPKEVGILAERIAVQVNNTLAGTYPKNPKGSCGFFLAGTEGIFSY